MLFGGSLQLALHQCYYCRFEKFWTEELKNHGREGASVARAIMKMIQTRIIVAVVLTFLFSALAILAPVSDFLPIYCEILTTS